LRILASFRNIYLDTEHLHISRGDLLEVCLKNNRDFVDTFNWLCERFKNKNRLSENSLNDIKKT